MVELLKKFLPPIEYEDSFTRILLYPAFLVVMLFITVNIVAGREGGMETTGKIRVENSLFYCSRVT